MPKIFYLSEIVKFAIEKELESFNFYKALAEKEKNSETKSVFEMLMREEKKHETFYKEMLNAVSAEQTPNVHEDDEYAVYMREMISESRKRSPLTVTEFPDTQSAIKYAIEKEMESIIFYVGLKNMIPEKDQIKIEGIIKEEAKHAAKLFKLKQQNI